MTMLMTLNKLNIKSDIEAFATIGIHLITQDETSRSNDSCSYRGTELPFTMEEEIDELEHFYAPQFWDGRSCAVGCLIKDEVYSPEIEDNPAKENIVINAVKASHPSWDINDISVYMMQSLQLVHDNVIVRDWPIYIRALYEIFFVEDERLNSIANQLFSEYSKETFIATQALYHIDKVVKLYPVNSLEICKNWVLTHLWGIFDKVETVNNASN